MRTWELDRPVHRNTEQAAMNRMGYESLIVVFELLNTVCRICHIFNKIRKVNLYRTAELQCVLCTFPF
jgi:hypothetical protein